MKKIFLIGAVALMLASCGNKNKNADNKIDNLTQTVVVDEHNAQNSLDYEGTYVGTLPAADAEGIETKITLEGDSYTFFSRFIGKNDQGTTNKGTYTWDEEGTIITLEGMDKPNQFFVGENVLFVLDTDGNRIEGDLADNYRLKKQ